MIVFKDILEKLAAVGWTTYRLRKEKILGSSTIDRLRTGQPITTESIDIICQLTGLQPGDLIEYQDAE